MNKKADRKQKRNYRLIALLLGLLLLAPALIQLSHVLEGHQHLGCSENSTHLHELDHDCDVLAFNFSPLSLSIIALDQSINLGTFNALELWPDQLLINSISSTTYTRGPPVAI